jgi:hypothetical protein
VQDRDIGQAVKCQHAIVEHFKRTEVVGTLGPIPLFVDRSATLG